MAPAWVDGIRTFMPLHPPLRACHTRPRGDSAAYRALAEATKAPFNGDEERTRCGELIEEAGALAQAACR
ncbi:hypothetical protein ACP4I1_33580 [Streptomyces sp. WG4]|uniref:hypothetical protein n=1 Tax=Streptomyces sp. WG4 TaxID=3417649 RepID=UPI003CF58976